MNMMSMVIIYDDHGDDDDDDCDCDDADGDNDDDCDDYSEVHLENEELKAAVSEREESKNQERR